VRKNENFYKRKICSAYASGSCRTSERGLHRFKRHRSKTGCFQKISGTDHPDPENVEKHYIEFPEKRLKYYRMLKEGQYWKDLPLDMQKEAMGKSFYLGGGKTGFLRRLSYSKPSPTLVTNPTMPATDLAHPTEDRPLSVEEYAGIQEFPQDWQICGAILDQYKQIGNAVPIKLGEAIAKTILDDMKGIHYKNTGFSYSRYKNTDEISWMNFMKKQLEKAAE